VISDQEFLADWCERAEARLAAARKKPVKGR